MSETSTNIYKAARLLAHMAREKAAFELGISTSSLKEYEIDYRPCPASTVLKMIRLYDAPQLRIQYLNLDPVFVDTFGKLPIISDRAINALRAQKEVGEAVEQFPQMVDQTIKKEHLDESIVKELREGAVALMIVACCEQKEKTPRANREPLMTKL